MEVCLMGWYLRRSIKIGPFRINASKSGLGVSAGVKGARIRVSQRGTEVHGGRGGIYYRKRIGGPAPIGSSAFGVFGRPLFMAALILAAIVLLLFLAAVSYGGAFESPAPKSCGARQPLVF